MDQFVGYETNYTGKALLAEHPSRLTILHCGCHIGFVENLRCQSLAPDRTRKMTAMKLKTPLTVSASCALAMVLISGPAYAASAEEISDLPSTTTEELLISSYANDVAADHGYRIQTDSSGHEVSVPVTNEARILAGLAVDSSGKPQGRGVVYDPSCGTATLYTTSNKQRGGVDIKTSYLLTNNAVSIGHRWAVAGTSNLGATFTESFDGINNKSSWSANHFRSLYGYAGGNSSLAHGSFVQLINGGRCTPKPLFSNW